MPRISPLGLRYVADAWFLETTIESMYESPPRNIPPTSTSAFTIAASKLQQTFPGFVQFMLRQIDTGLSSHEIALPRPAAAPWTPSSRNWFRLTNKVTNSALAVNPQPSTRPRSTPLLPTKLPGPPRSGTAAPPLAVEEKILVCTTCETRGVPKLPPPRLSPWDTCIIYVFRLALERAFATAGNVEAWHKHGLRPELLFLFQQEPESRLVFACTP